MKSMNRRQALRLAGLGFAGFAGCGENYRRNREDSTTTTATSPTTRPQEENRMM